MKFRVTNTAIGAIFCVAGLLPAACSGSDAATASAGSGLWAAAGPVTDNGSANWFYTTPTAKDTISWTSGANIVDGTTFGPFSFGPEPKFKIAPPAKPTGHAFKGFGPRTDTGVGGSKAITSGSGASGVASNIFGRTYSAIWSVTADGSLGSTLTATTPPWSWDATAIGADPMAITSDQLAAIHAPTYNLFFAAGLNGGNFSPRGDIGWDVSYQTAAGTEDLLHVKLDASGAQVTNDGPSNLTIYRLSSLNEGPTTISANILSLAQIQAILNGDLIGDVLTHPLYLGFVLNDQALPTTEMSDGAVADINVDAYAHDKNSRTTPVPEPSPITLFLIGAFGVAGCAVRRKKTSLG